jgi:hypothetical protein
MKIDTVVNKYGVEVTTMEIGAAERFQIRVKYKNIMVEKTFSKQPESQVDMKKFVKDMQKPNKIAEYLSQKVGKPVQIQEKRNVESFKTNKNRTAKNKNPSHHKQYKTRNDAVSS